MLSSLERQLRNSLGAIRTAIATASLDQSRCDRALDIARRQTDRLAQLIAGFTEAHRFVALGRRTIPVPDESTGEGSAESAMTTSTRSTAQASGGPGSRPHPGPARVLLVEDDPDAAESLTMLLEVLGHPVRVVHDGDAGLVAARTFVPDVMLIDIRLPGMDGYEVARQVRRDPALTNIVLAALTGYGGEEHRLRAMAAGFDCHVTKPLDVDALERLVAGLANGSSGRSDQPAP